MVEVPAAGTHDLRRRVLRENRPDADVVFGGDEVAGAFHLAVVDGEGAVVAVGSFAPEPTPVRPGRAAFRLRGMATDPAFQGRGLGRMLMAAAVDRLRREGAQVLWANARDSALGFYEGLGWEVVGDSFLTEIGIPHHVAVLDL